MSPVPRYGSDGLRGGLVDALDRAGCLVVTGMFDPLPEVADRVAPDLRAVVGYEMHRVLGSCVGTGQARRPKP